MHTVLRFGLAAALLCLVVLAAATIVLDRQVAEAVEQSTARALGVPVTLDRATVSLFTGRFTLNGLRVDNPPSFEGNRAIWIPVIEGRMRVRTAFRPVAELPSLTFSDVELRLETRDGRGNYEAMVEHYLREGRTATDDDRRYVVEELLVRDMTVHLDLGGDAVPDGSPRTVTLPEIRLRNVGDAEAGVILDEIAGIAARALFEAALERAAREIPDLILEELRDRVPEIPWPGGIRPDD